MLALLAAACSLRAHRVDADVEAAKRFDDFPLYWLGERFEQWSLTAISGVDPPGAAVVLIYGDCTPTGGDEPSCAPPLQLQVFPLCYQLEAVARAPIWKRRRIRGAPVGTIDSAPVLFTRGAQVKVYRGQGSDPGLSLRALRALRSLNSLPPEVGPTGPIPAPARGVLEGTRPCG